MNELEIRTLTERFFEGDTTLEEERRLYEYYRTAKQLPNDLLAVREMMKDMGCLSDISQSSAPQSEEKKGYHPSKRILAIAASFLMLLGIGTWWYYQEKQNECVTIAYGQRITDKEEVLKEMTQVLSIFTEDEATATMEEQMKELFSD